MSHTEAARPFTVKMLIDQLSKLPPERLIVEKGYEGGYTNYQGLRSTKSNMALNVNTNDWVGEHEVSGLDDEGFFGENVKTDIRVIL